MHDYRFIWPIMCLNEKQGTDIDCDYLNDFLEEIRCIYKKYDTFFCLIRLCLQLFVFTKQWLNKKQVIYKLSIFSGFEEMSEQAI